jgi:hypothetical protein
MGIKHYEVVYFGEGRYQVYNRYLSRMGAMNGRRAAIRRHGWDPALVSVMEVPGQEFRGPGNWERAHGM